ncbi:MAG: helix-turn-helix domain-containing protein [Fimbriimonadaceae bacterium]
MHDDKNLCPVWQTLNLLNQRWTLHIVRSLLGGKKRFNELSRENGINPRTLRMRLQQLELKCIISRHVVSTMPPNVEYELTDKGRALNDIFEALSNWGRDWMCPDQEPGGN